MPSTVGRINLRNDSNSESRFSVVASREIKSPHLSKLPGDDRDRTAGSTLQVLYDIYVQTLLNATRLFFSFKYPEAFNWQLAKLPWIERVFNFNEKD